MFEDEGQGRTGGKIAGSRWKRIYAADEPRPRRRAAHRFMGLNLIIESNDIDAIRMLFKISDGVKSNPYVKGTRRHSPTQGEKDQVLLTDMQTQMGHWHTELAQASYFANSKLYLCDEIDPEEASAEETALREEDGDQRVFRRGAQISFSEAVLYLLHEKATRDNTLWRDDYFNMRTILSEMMPSLAQPDFSKPQVSKRYIEFTNRVCEKTIDGGRYQATGVLKNVQEEASQEEPKGDSSYERSKEQNNEDLTRYLKHTISKLPPLAGSIELMRAALERMCIPVVRRLLDIGFDVKNNQTPTPSQDSWALAMVRAAATDPSQRDPEAADLLRALHRAGAEVDRPNRYGLCAVKMALAHFSGSYSPLMEQLMQYNLVNKVERVTVEEKTYQPDVPLYEEAGLI